MRLQNLRELKNVLGKQSKSLLYELKFDLGRLQKSIKRTEKIMNLRTSAQSLGSSYNIVL